MSTPGLDGPGLDQPGVGGGTLLEEAPAYAPEQTEPGDHEKFSHYAPKDKVMEAMVMGTPVTALCGKVWVPTRTRRSSRSARPARRSGSRSRRRRSRQELTGIRLR